MAKFFNPVEGPRIVPIFKLRLAVDKLPNGHPGFRVTQSYGPSVARPGTFHDGMDIANFYCGDKLIAMRAGVVSLRKDAAGALGVVIKHGSGWSTEVWHLSRYRVANGQKVRQGQHIGDVGATGIDVGGCHCHVVVRDPTGRTVDPWPTLAQNQ